MTTELDIRCESLALPEAGAARMVWVALAAPELPRKSERPPINLAVVLDRSGSMRGAKLDYAKQAALETIRVLDEHDRFALVTYDHEVEVVMSSRAATAANRREAEQVLAEVRSRGMTALHEGWQRGCKEVEGSLADGQLGRCLLLTDGLANEGLTERGAIVNDVARQCGRAVTTSTFGVGADFDEALLQGMSEAGAGNFYFIEKPAQIVEFIASEVGEVLEIAVPDASLVVHTSTGLAFELRSLNDYPVERISADQDACAWRVSLGSLVSGQLLDPMIELRFGPASAGTEHRIHVRLESRGESVAAPTGELIFSHRDAAAMAGASVDLEVVRRGARLEASRVSQRGLELNRARRYADATKLLEDAAAALRARAKGDPELVEIANELDGKARAYAEDLDPIMRKRRYYEDYSRIKGKLGSGRSRRRRAATEPASPVTAPTRSNPPTQAQVHEGPTPATGVVVLPTTLALVEQANRAVFALNSAGTELLPKLRAYPVLLPGTMASELDGRELQASEELALVDRAQKLAPNATIRLILTGRPFPDGWFSHTHPDARTTLATVAGWASLSPLAPEAFLAYQMLVHGLAATSPPYRHRALLHDETRGCLFDLCAEKVAITDKLRHADLCTDCERALTGLGIAVDQVRAVGAVVHHLARG